MTSGGEALPRGNKVDCAPRSVPDFQCLLILNKLRYDQDALYVRNGSSQLTALAEKRSENSPTKDFV